MPIISVPISCESGSLEGPNPTLFLEVFDDQVLGRVDAQ
jgi:hypothetical protein